MVVTASKVTRSNGRALDAPRAECHRPTLLPVGLELVAFDLIDELLGVGVLIHLALRKSPYRLVQRVAGANAGTGRDRISRAGMRSRQ